MYKFTFLPSGIAKDSTEQEHVASTCMSSLQTILLPNFRKLFRNNSRLFMPCLNIKNKLLLIKLNPESAPRSSGPHEAHARVCLLVTKYVVFNVCHSHYSANYTLGTISKWYNFKELTFLPQSLIISIVIRINKVIMENKTFCFSKLCFFNPWFLYILTWNVPLPTLSKYHRA